MSLELTQSKVPYQSFEDSVALPQQNLQEKKGTLETDDVVNHLVTFCYSSDLRSIAGVNRTFRDSSLKELILRFTPIMGRAESTEQMRARINAMPTAELMEHYSRASRAQHSIIWQNLRSDRKMSAFMSPVRRIPCLGVEFPDRPQLPALVRAMEEHHHLYIGDPRALRSKVDVLGVQEIGCKDLAYVSGLADSTQNMWRDLAADQRITSFIPPNHSKPQFEVLANNMERHYRSLGGDPELLMHGDRKDAAYFARLASAIKHHPLPEKSCNLNCMEDFSKPEKESFDCLVLTTCCSPAPVWALPIGLGCAGCSGAAIGIGFGVTAIAHVVSGVWFCCGLPSVAHKEKRFRKTHEIVQSMPDPVPVAPRLLAAPPPPPVRAADRDAELAAALLQEEVEGIAGEDIAEERG